MSGYRKRASNSAPGQPLELLRTLLLDSIVDTGEEIGKGAYGTVYKVRRWGTVCAAKKLHDLPLQLSGGGKKDGKNSGGDQSSILAKFERECHLLSTLRHPYIVQFLGVYIERTSGAPVIVMEYLPTSLSACLRDRPSIPMYLQISMLRNVGLGLSYLHGHNPPIIHRDLTANNVLLTSNMVAKVADLGVARILDLGPKSSTHLTQAPGTAAYMPPEALAVPPNYNTKIDTFSFGVLIVHLASQTWPVPTEAVRVVNGQLFPVSEAGRRQQQLDLMGSEHCLYPLALECLQNDPAARPEVSAAVGKLAQCQLKHPLPTTSYLDLLQVLESNRNQLEAKGVQLAANKDQLQTISLELEKRDREIARLNSEMRKVEKRLAGSLQGMLISPEDTSNIAVTPTSTDSAGLQQTQSAFIWKKDADLPVGLYGACGIILEDKLYVGGGDSKDLALDRVVHEYDINGIVRKWTTLPPSPVAYFAMANVNKSLTLIGGMEVSKRCTTNQLATWSKEEQKWTAPFPDMIIPRQDCTASTYQLWVLVAGGMNFGKPVPSVEVFDVATFQWHMIRPLPKPCYGMTSCVVENRWYVLGGINFSDPLKGETGPKQHVFSLALDENLIANKWNVHPDSPHYCSSAVPFGKFVMTVGGTDSLNSRHHSPAMHIYSSLLEKWHFIGAMPTARSRPTCVVLSKSRLIVLGGQERIRKQSRTVEILYC